MYYYRAVHKDFKKETIEFDSLKQVHRDRILELLNKGYEVSCISLQSNTIRYFHKSGEANITFQVMPCNIGLKKKVSMLGR